MENSLLVGLYNESLSRSTKIRGAEVKLRPNASTSCENVDEPLGNRKDRRGSEIARYVQKSHLYDLLPVNVAHNDSLLVYPLQKGGTAVIKLRTKSKSTLGREVRGITGVL